MDEKSESSSPAGTTDMKIAFVEVDSIMSQYKYCKEYSLILQKKLHELDAKLAVKSVKMTLSQAAFDYLLRKGFTAEYGAREIDRIISKKLKPLLMHEILFGSLRNGGAINVDLNNGCLSIR